MLDHPRICTLFDVGPDYLVMEYVDGAPLQGPTPLERALAYGAQICEALDAAHRKGITHRDLKPGNILITKSGIKLLDFGLAKVGAAVVADEAALTRAVTQQGQILGTLHYMSPEQLQGQEAGPSSDIFAFGLVLYEMLTGKRAFDGSSPASVIAAILERPAPSIADVAPAALDRTLRRCLEKDPERRWHSAADLKAELEWIAAGASGSVLVPAPANRPWAWIATVVALFTAVGVALWAPWRTTPSVPTYTFSIAPSQGGRFLGGPVISPDGTRVAVRSDADGGRLEIHNLESGTSQTVAGAESGVAIASWSPDGRSLAFFEQLELKRVDIAGGRPVKIADGPGVSGVPLVSWSKDGLILLSGRDGLYVVSASGGQARKVTAAPPNTRGLDSAPQFLPDGRRFLYWRLRPPARLTGTVFVGSIDAPPDQNNTAVLRDTSPAVFGRDAKGHAYLLFVRDDTLMAQAFDTAALKTSGDPFVVASQIGMNGPVPGVSISDTGVLAYTSDATGGRSIVQLAWFDRSGTRLAVVGQPAQYREFSLSPDESQVAVAITEKDETDIFLLDVKSGVSPPMRFTFDPAQERSPVWSPDGKRVAFARSGKGIVEKQIGGTATEQLLIQASGRPTHWSRDGRLVYSLDEDIMLLTDGKPAVYRHTDFIEEFARLSPDGSLLAYTSTDSRRVFDVYVETVPASDARWQISDGGFQPRWGSDGREMFYIRYADAMLMTVPIMPGPRFGVPTPLFRVDTVGLERGFAVSANGQRFLIPTMVTSTTAAPITVTTKWAPER